VCKIRTIVALYQIHGGIGRNDVEIDTKQQKVCIAEERIRYGEFVNWLNELVLFFALIFFALNWLDMINNNRHVI
jgi:hypothetical protein